MSKLNILTFAGVLLVGLFSNVSATIDSLAPEYRSFDGYGNNLNNPEWGIVGRYFSRGDFVANYKDGISEIVDAPNGRDISNLLYKGDEVPPPPPGGRSSIYTPPSTVNANIFREHAGQFISHGVHKIQRIVSISEGRNITVRSNDDVMYDSKRSPEDNVILFFANKYEISGETGQAEIPNGVNSFHDLSQVYGTNAFNAAALRTHSGGRMKTADYQYTPTRAYSPPVAFTDLLPPASEVKFQGNKVILPRERIFLLAGDPRDEENAVVTVQHVIWLRNHNRIADRLAAANPVWNDETLYQEARRRNIAYFQKFVMYEYLPAVLGPNIPIPRYRGYDDGVDPTTTIAFNVGLRYGHSSINDWKVRQPNGCPKTFQVPTDTDNDPSTPPVVCTTDKLPFAGTLGGPIGFFQVLELSGNMTNIVVGTITSLADEVDIKIAPPIRSIPLPGQPTLGLDLALFDDERLKNIGAPYYYDFRRRYMIRGADCRGRYTGIRAHRSCCGRFVKRNPKSRVYKRGACRATRRSQGPDPIECFLAVTPDFTTAKNMRKLFGKVSKIPALTGMLAEPLFPRSSVSATVAGILLETYLDKRDGDRFWFENDPHFTQAELDDIWASSMSGILMANGIDAELPPDVLFRPDPDTSPLQKCSA